MKPIPVHITVKSPIANISRKFGSQRKAYAFLRLQRRIHRQYLAGLFGPSKDGYSTRQTAYHQLQITINTPKQ